MCGIVGVAGLGSPIDSVDDLLEPIRHRGPDGEGWVEGNGYVLGHTRLAIQDVSDAAAQPFKTDHITLTYNGELWNPDHGEIRVEHKATSGDTEVVAWLLDNHGTEALHLMDGMWAMAWHDDRDGLIYLARDRWGKVPLYWGTNGLQVFWASEHGALPEGVVGEAVEPGCILTIEPVSGWVLDSRQWAEHYSWSYDTSPEMALSLLRQGVSERLIGDRPFAFMLSGGLDSTLILALALEAGVKDPVAYTAVGDPASDDLAAARDVASEYGVELVEVPIPDVTNQRLIEAIKAVEIPMKAQVEIALAHLPVMKAMRSDGFVVALSGEAADELFGGYGGMQIKASSADDEGYRKIKRDAVDKMARGNFSRVNKVGMAHGIECRLPFMQHDLVDLALSATKAESPPGKKLLKAAAEGIVPDRIIKRPKQTFQGGVGTGTADKSITATYNKIARDLFGYIPRR